MNTSDIIILATIIVYMAAMVVIGIVLSRRNSNVGDFYLEGRKLDPLVTAKKLSRERKATNIIFLDLHRGVTVSVQSGPLAKW